MVGDTVGFIMMSESIGAIVGDSVCLIGNKAFVFIGVIACVPISTSGDKGDGFFGLVLSIFGEMDWLVKLSIGFIELAASVSICCCSN